MRRSAVVLVLLGALLSGCAASAADIQPMAADALSAARSADLGIDLDKAGRTFPTTAQVVLEDMATQLGDVITQLEETPTADDAAERDRTRTLSAARDAIDAIHTALRRDDAPAQRAHTPPLEVDPDVAGKR